MHELNLIGIECPDNILITKLDYKEYGNIVVTANSDAYKTSLESWAKYNDAKLDFQNTEGNTFKVIISKNNYS